MEVILNIFDNILMFFAMMAVTVVWPQIDYKKNIWFQVFMGLLFSVMALFVMMNSVHVGDGLYIDARYAIPIIAVIYFGVIPGALSVVTIILVRIFILGGLGVPVGVSFAIIQFVVVWIYKVKYYDKREDSMKVSSFKLFLLAFALQLILASLPLVFFPIDVALDAIKSNAFYLISIYPALVYIFSIVVSNRHDYINKVKQENLRDKYFKTILHRSPTPIAIIDEQGNFVHVNETWMHHSKSSEFVYKTVDEWYEDVLTNYGAIQKGVRRNGKPIEYHIDTEFGQRVWTINKKEIQHDHSEDIYSVLIATDITERKRYEEELLDVSFHDFLTGLYNRRFYNEVFELNRFDTEDVFVIYGDMNNLKSVNDYYGHNKGDKAIQVCAKVLNKYYSKDSTLFRFGGDEFLIVSVGVSKQEHIDRINLVTNELKKFDFGKIKIGISLGLHPLELNQTLDEGVMKAESRMYEYKIFESSSARSGTVDVILTMLFEKDSETERHSKRVQDICREFIGVLDLNTSETSLLLRAALLHDIGKILIPTSIILSEKKLSPDERIIIENHSNLGYRILASKDQLKDIGEIVLSHHEKVDGSGYPNKLKGEEIPYIARILHIVDAFEAMTSNRPYAKKLSYEETAEELKRCSGTQFDTELVEKFLKIMYEIPKT